MTAEYIPEEYIPVVALRDVVVFPGSTVYLEIGRKKTVKAIQEAMTNHNRIFTVAQKNAKEEDPGQEGLYETGTLAEVKQIVKMPDGINRVVIVGLKRMTLCQLVEREDCLYAGLEEKPDEGDLSYTLEVVAMVRGLKDLFRVYVTALGSMNEKLVEEAMEQTDLSRLMDQVCADIPVNYQIKQSILEEVDLFARHEKLSVVLSREIGILRIQEDIASRVKGQVDENQKEYYLREQIKAIYKELGEDDAVSDADRYKRKLEELKAPKKVRRKLEEEIRRFKKTSSNSSENSVIRGYIETLLEFPWKKTSRDQLDIAYAEKILNEDHYGLEKVKERVLECLSVRALKQDGASPIICLVGPPGTGKTSIARSVARAMNRKYVRICLGGVREEAEIRGHRRTYVGAMPGRIVTGLKNAGVKNPVMLLDEIDKLGGDYKGDPSSALLEVLDPEQNKHFSDHYIELPVDLSQVMFLCTANSLDPIPRPLLDRMEVIELSGYTANEKYHIAKEHLLEKQKNANGLTKQQLTVSEKALRTIISGYTREAGVRGLEKKIAAVCRKAAREVAQNQGKKVRVSERNIKQYLGKELYQQTMANELPEIGVVRGLAWTSVGGDTLEIEVNIVPGTGKLELTGKLGEVMQESAKIALTYVKSRVQDEKDSEYFEKRDIHIHVPEGAVPKDGPSAGVTMATALYSAIMEKAVRPDIAMTGEITLRGRVLPIGGLKEKLLAAKAAGIKLVMVPEKNKKDIMEMEQEVLEEIEVRYASQVKDIWKLAFSSGN